MVQDPRPLIAHVVFRFGVGGLENGVANLINHMAHDRWRHAVIALDHVEPAMQQRVRRGDVRFVALEKPPGHLWRLYPRLVRLLRELRPTVLHTRNLAALEAVVPGALAGVPLRVHGEHGWDTHDPDGRSTRYRLVRRAFRPFVHHHVALSGQINAYLTGPIGVSHERVSRLCNGVDMSRFVERGPEREGVDGMPFDRSAWVLGTVGRLQAVKDQGLLLQALAIARRDGGEDARRLRLAVVGDGPLRQELEALARRLHLEDVTWFLGERADVPSLLRAMDQFVLPSLAEGISNTVLEAMAAGLPVVATDVGGNAELIEHGVTGHLIPRRDAAALAEALLASVRRPDEARAAGRAGRLRVAQRFSIEAMVRGYESMYTTLLARRGIEAAATIPQT